MEIGVLWPIELYPREALSACGPGINPLERGVIEGENPVFDLESAAYDASSKSRVAWECSSKRVVNFI